MLDEFSHDLGPYGPIKKIWAHMGLARAPPERLGPGASGEAKPSGKKKNITNCVLLVKYNGF